MDVSTYYHKAKELAEHLALIYGAGKPRIPNPSLIAIDAHSSMRSANYCIGIQISMSGNAELVCYPSDNLKRITHPYEWPKAPKIGISLTRDIESIMRDVATRFEPVRATYATQVDQLAKRVSDEHKLLWERIRAVEAALPGVTIEPEPLASTPPRLYRWSYEGVNAAGYRLTASGEISGSRLGITVQTCNTSFEVLAELVKKFFAVSS